MNRRDPFQSVLGSLVAALRRRRTPRFALGLPRRRWRHRIALLLLTLAAATPAPAFAATFLVNVLTDADDVAPGDSTCETAAGNAQCSLRAAIQEANALAGPDNIGFALTGTVAVGRALPAITESVNIAGPSPAGSVIVSGAAAGAALLRYTATATGDSALSNLTFRGGRTTDPAGGGGLYFGPASFSSLILTDVRIEDSDAAAGPGGGIAVAGNNELVMTRGAVTGNTAAANGGGISVTRGSLKLTDVTVSGNAGLNGGGVSLAGGELQLSGTTLADNDASQDGGGLYLGTTGFPESSSTAALRSCTIAGNTAVNGGGIGAGTTQAGASSMVHCTVAGNVAHSAGGGLGLVGVGNANRYFPGNDAHPFTNNIVADNFIGTVDSRAPRSDCRQAFSHSDPEDSGFNVSGDASCGFPAGFSGKTNCTGSLADRRGLTWTRALNATCVAAIDAANPVHASTADQRGAPLADGDRSGSVERDIGAYEYAAYGAFELLASTATVREDAGILPLEVRRYGNLDTSGDVAFATTTSCTPACTATAGSDFAPASGTLQWASGAGAPQPIMLTILDDTLTAEGGETFVLALSSPSRGADLSNLRPETRVTIGDIENGALQFGSTEQTLCEASVQQDPLSCPPDGATQVSFSVRRVGANGSNEPVGPNDGNEAVGVTLVFGGNARRAAGATCADGDDYVASATELAWSANDTAAKPVTLTACNDSFFEVDETLEIALQSPTGGARLGTPATAAATLVSDDAPVRSTLQFSAAAYSAGEPAGSVTITVERTASADEAVSVDYRTSSGSAQAGADFSSRSGTLTWANGDDAPKTFSVPIADDDLREGVESFSVVLSNPQNLDSTLDPELGALRTASVTIASEDKMRFRFTQPSWTALEGGPATLAVEPLQAVVDGPYTLTWSTIEGTAGAADYEVTTGTLTFADGETQPRTFQVATRSDTAIEGDETFQVMLAVGGDHAVVLSPNPGTVTISENDVGFALDAASYAATEGAAAPTVKVRRVGAASGAVSVGFTTTAATATAGADYVAASGTLSWPDGDVSDKVISLAIADDALDEPAESFTIALETPSGGTQLLSPSQAQVSIADNDAAPVLSIAPASSGESAGELVFAVTLSSASGQTVTVDYASANGTATAGADYTAIGGTLSFAPGETSKTLPVAVLPDSVDEPDETLAVSLSGPVNALIGTASATGTIVDDDAVSPASAGDSGGGGAVPLLSLLVLLGSRIARAAGLAQVMGGSLNAGLLLTLLGLGSAGCFRRPPAPRGVQREAGHRKPSAPGHQAEGSCPNSAWARFVRQ